MRAAVVEGPGILKVRNLPAPEMGDYEARCELLCGTVCAGTDHHLVSGHVPFSRWMTLPFILGHESVGRVIETGARVRYLKPGDVVTRVGSPPTGGVNSGWGGFAEIGIASDWKALREDGQDGWKARTVQQVLPPDIDPEVGALFITWRETLSYLTRMGVGPGCSVLVIGSGGNGLAFVSHARSLGASRVVMMGSLNREKQANETGATAFFDYRMDGAWEGVRASAPDGFDFVVDALGRRETVLAAQRALRESGTLGIYGMDEAELLVLSPGAARGSFTFYNSGYDEAEAHNSVLAGVRKGKLNPAVWLDRGNVFTLDEIGQALEAVRNRSQVKPLVKIGMR